jgi:hypothetical protein
MASHLQLAGLPAALTEVLEHARTAATGLPFPAGEDFHAGAEAATSIRSLVVECASQHLAEALTRRTFLALRLGFIETDAPRRRQQHVEDAFLGGFLGAELHLGRRLLAHLLDCGLHQVADDGVDVAPDVADLGELGRLDLDEGRVGEPRQAAGDFGLADAGRTDHQDVLRRDFLAQRLGDLLSPPAVAQGDRDCALGGS